MFVPDKLLAEIFPLALISPEEVILPSVCNELEYTPNTSLLSKVVVLVLNEALGAKNEPVIIAGVNTSLLSKVVVLVLNEALGAVNDPEIEASIWLDDDIILAVWITLVTAASV